MRYPYCVETGSPADAPSTKAIADDQFEAQHKILGNLVHSVVWVEFTMARRWRAQMTSIQYHSERAAAERLIAVEASGLDHAAIHVALAEMHEQVVARDVNQSLAPFEHSQTWTKFAV